MSERTAVETIPPPTILRHKTAIRRYQPSRPIALALDHDLIAPGIAVLDYGCGRGDDVSHLRERGIAATGWDPHFYPDNPIAEADVVNLGYVLNVVENPRERENVLARAFSLAKNLLIVAVRVDQGPEAGEAFNDGLITARNGFQKLYSQFEFRQYVETITKQRPIMAGLGVAYLFRDEAWHDRYLAQKSVRRPTLGRQFAIEDFQSSEIGGAYLDLARRLTRLPRPREFAEFANLKERFGSSQRIARIASAILDPNHLENLRRQRRDDFLVYYASTRLQGRQLPRFNLLLEETQADILSIWPSFSSAKQDGESFLFSLGDPEQVRAANAHSPVGKFVGDALYVHRSVVDQLRPLSRLQIAGAHQIVGDVAHDVVKLSADGRKVSFLRYPQFDKDAHPRLADSLVVYLPKTNHSYRDFRDSSNPPILHRKETLVDETYPLYEKFEGLTRQEEKRGLLGRIDIGFKLGWETILAEAGLTIKGHRLLRRKASA